MTRKKKKPLYHGKNQPPLGFVASVVLACVDAGLSIPYAVLADRLQVSRQRVFQVVRRHRPQVLPKRKRAVNRLRDSELSPMFPTETPSLTQDAQTDAQDSATDHD